ncbi:MAG: DUF3597 family protein [Sphingomicrobium sp.]
MSLFGSILNKILGRKNPEPAPAGAGGTAADGTLTQQSAPAPTQSVDVGAVLAEMAAGKDGGGNYKSSIVDLLKLLDLDSSLSARKELGEELGVNAGEDGSSEQNIALHKAVMDKLEANGGVVPDDLRN